MVVARGGALTEQTPVTMVEGPAEFELGEAGSGGRYGYCASPGESLQLAAPAFGGMQVGGLHSLLATD